jgi:hypothetical protein
VRYVVPFVRADADLLGQGTSVLFSFQVRLHVHVYQVRPEPSSSSSSSTASTSNMIILMHAGIKQSAPSRLLCSMVCCASRLGLSQ